MYKILPTAINEQTFPLLKKLVAQRYSAKTYLTAKVPVPDESCFDDPHSGIGEK